MKTKKDLGAMPYATPWISFDERIVVSRPIQECFEFILNLENLPEWNPSVSSIKKASTARRRLTSVYMVDFQLGLIKQRIRCRLSSVHEPKRIVIHGENLLLQFEDTISLSREYGMTVIHYVGLLKMKGRWQWLTPIIRLAFEKGMQKTLKALDQVLEEKVEIHPITLREQMADYLILPGLAKFTRFGYALERRKWRPYAKILKGKNVLITGGSSGIGRAAAFAFCRFGANVVVISHNGEKGKKLQQEVFDETGESLVYINADLSEIGRIPKVADFLTQSLNKLDILVNNAGDLFKSQSTTREGLEKTFALLLLSPYVLTETLYPLLKKSGDARIINVSSGGMYAKALDLNDPEFKTRPYSGVTAYAQAKRGLVDLTELWASKWRQDQISVHCMHPGWVDTEGVSRALPLFYRLTKPLLRSAQQGADTIVWLATAPNIGQKSGKFWLDRRPHPTAVFVGTKTSKEGQERLYKILYSYWQGLDLSKTGT